MVTVIVESQGLYFESIVGPSLPPNGPFQELRFEGGMLVTEFGPGEPGYVGGRWRMETPEGEVVYFSCPTLGHGSPQP